MLHMLHKLIRRIFLSYFFVHAVLYSMSSFMIYIVISGFPARQFLCLFINLREIYNSSAYLINRLYMEIIS